MADTTSSPAPGAPGTPGPIPSFDTAPRLQSASADPASAYAPIAWSAVAALGIGGLFVAVLLLYGYTSFRQREPLVAPWLFAFPVLGIATAFVARRQIANSEGTRIGTQYAVAGWWLCVVGGLIYAAYFATLGYTVRSDANAAFREWANNLSGVNPDAADQPALFAALYRTLPPSQRIGLDPEAATLDEKGRAAARDDMRKRFAPQLQKLRQSPVLLQAARYGDECTFTPDAMRAWQYQSGKIECALAVTMRTPEGDFQLSMPMEAAVGRGGREWQVKATEGGLTGDLRTPFGFLVGEWVTPSAVRAASQFLDGQKQHAERKQKGGPPEPGAVPAVPAAVYEAFAAGRVLSLPDGVPPADDQLREFRAAWESEPYRFEMTGLLPEAMGENPSVPSLQLLPDRVRASVPCQYKSRKAQVVANTAGSRMRLILECTDPAVLKELTATRATAGTDPRKSPAEIAKDFPALATRARDPIALDKWTAVRFESDLVILQPPPSGPGGPGGPGGMPGMGGH